MEVSSLATTVAPVKLTVNLPRLVWETLQRLAEDQGITKTEALRRAISTEAFRHEVQKAGDRIMVERKDGNVERVVFPY